MVDPRSVYCLEFDWDYNNAIAWAQERLMFPNEFVVLDTETTGLHKAQIIEIAIVDSSGNALLNTLVKPTICISPGATQVHGISDKDVALAPDYASIERSIYEICFDKICIIYNAVFDTDVIHNCADIFNRPYPLGFVECAMLPYSAFCGDWSEYRQSYKWQKLPGQRKHRALDDCKAVLQIIKEMAAMKTRPGWDE